MRKSFLSAFATVVLTGGALVGTALPAQADAPTTLYVRQNPPATAPTSTRAPWSSRSAPSVPRPQWSRGGQIVDIGGGNYRERVTIRTSGTPEQPVTFFATSSSGATLVGATAGFVIDGQHDVVLQNLRVVGSGDVPALDAAQLLGHHHPGRHLRPGHCPRRHR